MSQAYTRDYNVRLPSIPLETRTDLAAILTIELCLFDGLMTLPQWHLEGNPVVLALGPTGMLTAKLIGVSGLLWLWFYHRGARTSNVAQACVWLLCGLYATVVVTNLAVLLAF